MKFPEKALNWAKMKGKKQENLQRKAEGRELLCRRLGVPIKTLVVGIKPTKKEKVFLRASRLEIVRPYFNPTFLCVGSLYLLSSAPCLVNFSFPLVPFPAF